jgi:Conserved TM helix
VFLAADIGDSVQRSSDQLFEWLPRLVGALGILLVAYIVAKVIRKVIENALPRTGVDRAVHSGQYGQYVARYASGFTPSTVIGAIAFWFIFLTGLLLALSTLGVEALNNAVASVVGYLPNVVAAIIILVVAIAVAGVVGGAVTKLMGDTALGKITAAVIPVLVITIATFMALVQLDIAVEIVTGMFYIVLGGIALAAALAFGLGGRNAAQRLLDGAYEKGQQAVPQVRQEIAVGKERAAERAHDAQQEMAEHGAAADPDAMAGAPRDAN